MTAASSPHVLIVGGGGTGGALAHDLTLRGVRVTLVERGEFTSGTTGRHHGLLHSGARYAVNDAESAVECIEENMLLRRIAPGSFEANDGLFVGVTDEDMAYLPAFLEGCEATGIPTQVLLPAAQSLGVDPVHFGVVAVLNIMIGLVTPPYGLLLFMMVRIANVPLGGLTREVLPFLAVMLAALALVTLVPDLVLFLPRLLGYKG